MGAELSCGSKLPGRVASLTAIPTIAIFPELGGAREGDISGSIWDNVTSALASCDLNRTKHEHADSCVYGPRKVDRGWATAVDFRGARPCA